MQNIKVYADGFDRWHIEGTTDRDEAIRLIASELIDREPVSFRDYATEYLDNSIHELSPGHWVEWVEED